MCRRVRARWKGTLRDDGQGCGCGRGLGGGEASRRLAELFSPEGIDRILADAQVSGTPLDGRDGILNQMSRAVIERALGVEMNDHLGYPKHDTAGRGTGNSRNGYSAKTVTPNTGKVRIQVPRDRTGAFEPQIVKTHQRRLGQIDDMILSLYSRGMTTRDIQGSFARGVWRRGEPRIDQQCDRCGA